MRELDEPTAEREQDAESKIANPAFSALLGIVMWQAVVVWCLVACCGLFQQTGLEHMAQSARMDSRVNELESHVLSLEARLNDLVQSREDFEARVEQIEAKTTQQEAGSGTIPLHRYYHPGKSCHFYSNDASEIGVTQVGEHGAHGYRYEGVVGYLKLHP
jgi:hypothetical protein